MSGIDSAYVLPGYFFYHYKENNTGIFSNKPNTKRST